MNGAANGVAEKFRAASLKGWDQLQLSNVAQGQPCVFPHTDRAARKTSLIVLLRCPEIANSAQHLGYIQVI